MQQIEVALMEQISDRSVMRKITPWIIGVTIVFLGMFMVGIAVVHQTRLGAGVAIAVVLIGVLTVFRWFLKSDNTTK
jgi:hypothetical protein